MTPAPRGDTPGRSSGVGYGMGLAAFAAILLLALVVCALGVISLLTDTDVVPERDAGPLVGPVMAGAAVLAGLISMLTLAARGRVPRILPTAIVAGIVVTAVYVVAGAAVYALATRSADDLIGFALARITEPYAITVGVLAAVVHAIFLLLLARHDAGGGPPQWTWEQE